ncbi:tape measure protein [Acidaminococcus timonensis]|uniref:tape measure protein n=1 Tax=Acidaminococcus timonensis TaxID=1871002 RepID=UPI002941CC0E|nr:tape measure protein [Acidaminococcus timonensis]
MSNNRIDITLEADASGAIRVIKQVSTSVDQLAGKKVGNAGMPELANGAQRASQSLKQTKADTDALASAIGKIKGMIAGAFAVKSIVDFGKNVLGAAANMEVFKKGLSFTLGSEGEADHLIASMQQIGEESAYDTTQLLPLARQWVNIGNTSDEAISKMKKIVDLGSAYGMQTEQIQAANLALTQMSMAGKIGAQDMMQLINAGVPAWQLLADKMGLSVAEVRELSQEGALGEEAIGTLWDAITEKTQGAADTMGNTLMAKFSNMQESVTNSMAGIGDIIAQGFDLKDVLTDMGTQTEAFKQHINNIKEAAKQVGVQQAIVDELNKISPAAATAAGGVMSAFSTVKKIVTENQGAIKLVTEAVIVFGGTIALINGIQSGFAALKGAVLAVNAAIMANPTVIIAAAIVAALVLIYTHWDEIKAVVSSVAAKVSEKCAEIEGAIKEKIGEAIAWVKGQWEGLVQAFSHPIDFVVNKVEKIRREVSETGSASTADPGFAQGGVLGRFASGGVVGGRIPALANGGQLKHGTPAIVGEAGPEAVIPLKKAVLGPIGQSIAESAKISSFVQGAVEDAVSMDANKKNPVYNTRKSFSDTTKPKDVDAYTKILDETKQKILKINEAQAKFHEEWQKAQEDASKYTEGGEKALAFQKQMASNQEKIAKLQEKISSGNGDAKDAEALKILQLQTQNRIAEYEKEKAAAIAAAQETQDAITNIDAEAEAARQKVKQQAIDQMGSYETQLAQAQYAQKKAMMATELDDFLAQMTAKDEITGQSYATTLANEQYLAEQRRVWMEELMLASVSWGEYMQTMLTNMAVQVQDGIASGIAQCVVEGKKFSEVMSSLAKTLLKQLIQGVVQKLIAGWITAIGLANNRHKAELKNTMAETSALGAKLSVETAIAAAAAAAANPHRPASAAAEAVAAVTAAAAAGAALGKAAMAVFKTDSSGGSIGDTQTGVGGITTTSTGPGINIGDTSLMDRLPGMATGGVVTGPTAALIGEGRYDEAVLPLKPSLLEKLFGSGESRQTTVVANQNIYGDINTREDDEDMFGGFNDLVLAGLRGA